MFCLHVCMCIVHAWSLRKSEDISPLDLELGIVVSDAVGPQQDGQVFLTTEHFPSPFQHAFSLNTSSIYLFSIHECLACICTPLQAWCLGRSKRASHPPGTRLTEDCEESCGLQQEHVLVNALAILQLFSTLRSIPPSIGIYPPTVCHYLGFT